MDARVRASARPRVWARALGHARTGTGANALASGADSDRAARAGTRVRVCASAHMCVVSECAPTRPRRLWRRGPSGSVRGRGREGRREDGVPSAEWGPPEHTATSGRSGQAILTCLRSKPLCPCNDLRWSGLRHPLAPRRCKGYGLSSCSTAGAGSPSRRCRCHDARHHFQLHCQNESLFVLSALLMLLRRWRVLTHLQADPCRPHCWAARHSSD